MHIKLTKKTINSVEKVVTYQYELILFDPTTGFDENFEFTVLFDYNIGEIKESSKINLYYSTVDYNVVPTYYKLIEIIELVYQKNIYLKTKMKCLLLSYSRCLSKNDFPIIPNELWMIIYEFI